MLIKELTNRTRTLAIGPTSSKVDQEPASIEHPIHHIQPTLEHNEKAIEHEKPLFEHHENFEACPALEENHEVPSADEEDRKNQEYLEYQKIIAAGKLHF